MRKAGRQNASTAARRRQIIEAALGCFVEMGFVNVTMEDIRARSGASNGSIYHHFGSKELLAASIYMEGIVDYQDGLLGVLEGNPGGREGISSMVRYHLTWIRDNPLWSRYLFQMRHAEFMESTEESIKERNRIFITGISEWFRGRVAAGEFRILPPELYVSLILGPCQEFARHWLMKGSGMDLDLVIAEISRAAWQALKSGRDE